jgi:hypothetical protein
MKIEQERQWTLDHLDELGLRMMNTRSGQLREWLASRVALDDDGCEMEIPNFGFMSMRLVMIGVVRQVWDDPIAFVQRVSDVDGSEWELTLHGPRVQERMKTSWGETKPQDKICVYGHTELEACIKALEMLETEA